MNAVSDGWKSRKLWTAFAAMALIVVGFVLCKDRNAAFVTYTTGILTAAGLLKAANLVEKALGRSSQSVQPPCGPTANLERP